MPFKYHRQSGNEWIIFLSCQLHHFRLVVNNRNETMAVTES